MPIIEFKDKASFKKWLPQGVLYREMDTGDVIHYFNPGRRKYEIGKTKVAKDALGIEIERRGFNADMLERQRKAFFTVLFASDDRLLMLGVFAEYPKGLLWYPVGRRG